MMHAVIVFCATCLVFVIVLAAGVFWLTLLRKQKLAMIIFGVITAVLAYVLAKAGSAVFYDTRPFIADHVTPLLAHSNDNGFPSDHTLLSSVVAITVYAMSKKWGMPLLVLALGVGAARIAAHVHRPIDILGSLVFAAAGGLVAWYVTPKICARVLK